MKFVTAVALLGLGLIATALLALLAGGAYGLFCWWCGRRELRQTNGGNRD